ncbi:MAG: DUF4231 domain-containing protein [Ignavibacteria bacterium]|nr:DUF4231 domain-containing protein [Ignavibacteria bacterium]
MKTNDFPSLFQAADKASITAQKNYLIIMGLDLAFMIIGSLLAIYSFKCDFNKLIIYSVSGLFLLTSLILTIVLKSKAFEDIWYQGRALAESVKTLTWRFATCSELFEVSLSKTEVNQIFIDRLKKLSNEFKELNKTLDANILSLPIITQKMESIRELTTIERKDYYVKERIKDQKEWYSTKAELNKTKYNFWFWVIIFFQFLSLASIIILIKNPSLDWNLVGLFTTISAAAISWLQLKQYQELKQAYTTAAQELNFIEALSFAITNETELSGFILDSENAISREHTLWLAQKRK